MTFACDPCDVLFARPVAEFKPPPNLDQLWTKLLEDSLSVEKRASLQANFDACETRQDQYMMFLEYTSYLRKPTGPPQTGL